MSTATAQPAQDHTLLGEVHTRFIRQADFVPARALEEKRVWIIGCGAIGRQVALQLAAIGVRELGLVDFDTVTPTNVTTQGFTAADVGKEKVFALEEAIKGIDPDIKVHPICDKFRPEQKLDGVVFVCVDSIEARHRIMEVLGDKVELLIDGRMLGENWRVLAFNDKETKDHYKSTLFPPGEAIEGRCTAHATIYSAAMPASWMVHQLTKHLRGFGLDQDMACNMLAGEFCPVIIG